ncbi:MAG: choice-of-anchor L domain-containing protein [Desulfobulbaceae bacterium]|nr:choice-of-anchor L domain-containing protein [Desulfobulbaceae bacterium]HIJ90339.1 hypothetical protein [Deltaproteobacteria bacterium]
MSVFTLYNPATHSLSSLTGALLSASSGITVDAASISLKYGSGTAYDDYYTPRTTSSISFYDGSISSLGVGAGLLLTSGDGDLPQSNSQSGYGVSLDPSETDTDLSATVHSAFSSAGEVQDATVLQFQFTVSSSTTQSVQFDLVFGSDEYQEYSNSSYVDIAGVYINGVNYALFNNSASQPLSILEGNLLSGNFRDNASGTLPLEYDGISNKLTIVAPTTLGTNTIKIAVADTGDQDLDSGLFIANLRAVDYAGNGLALETTATSSADWITGNNFNDVIDLGDSDDIVNGGLGDDLLNGGSGYDAALFSADLSQYTLAPTSNGFAINGPDGQDVLVDVEFGLFGSSLYALDTQPTGMTYGACALLTAAFDSMPSTDLLSQWVASAKGNGISDLSELGQLMIETLAPGISNETLVAYLYQTVVGITPSSSDVAYFSAMIGPGNTFGSQGAIFAYAAQLELNTANMSSIVGQPILLNLDYFV